ncbi:MAG TPA: TolC family protein [Burkholderiaceae bacterium]|nr:TolC family protein [Burkholderiaceae bacterium]
MPGAPPTAGPAPASAPLPAAPDEWLAPAYSLPALIEMARANSPSLAASQARIPGAEAGIVTARALPNPEVEALLGRQSPSAAGTSAGATGLVGLTLPFDRPSLRRARQEAAFGDLDATRAGVASFERNLVAEVKLRYLDVLRLQAAARLAEQDLSIAEQIRTRVGVRVGTGESPRFELIRADAERLNAQRALQGAALRIDVARAELRRLVGPVLPAEFAVAGNIEDVSEPPAALETIRAEMLERHPELRTARAELRAAESRVELERERARPSFALRASVDRLPEATDSRLGIVVRVPVFDRREGPIAEARAEAERARFALADRELQLRQSLDAAWQRYRIAQGQVAAFESGILREAEAALRVAEAAYRFGERGILDFLDAQRTLRTVRADLNASRFELRTALVELERLRAESE